MRASIFALVVAMIACGREVPAPDPHAGHVAPPSAPPDGQTVDHSVAHGAVAEGHTEVEIAPDRQQAIGLRLAIVTRGAIGGSIRASGIVLPDERRQAHVHSRLMGNIRKLQVNAVGQQVRRGQALYTIYSQDLLVAQQEYLRARAVNPDLAAAARERLRLWDIPEDQIRAIEAKGTPVETMTVRSPISGTVIEKRVVEGHFVEPDMMLYLIADLTRVWVVAEVYEYELGRIDRAGSVTIRFEGRAEPISARIDYFYPTVDPASRTVKVRMVVDNPTGELRPGSFATVELPVTGGEMVTVPEEAVIDTGVRQLVYVAVGETAFRPVEVTVGARAGGRAEIRQGLQVGDRVVASAQFLVDSESRLRAGGAAPGHGGH